MADLERTIFIPKPPELVESTAIGAGETRDIEVGDVAELVSPDRSERYQIFLIEVKEEVEEDEQYDVIIYLEPYLIKYRDAKPPKIKHLIETNTWVISGQPEIKVNFHPRPVIPRSKAATKYLRKKAGRMIYRMAFRLDPVINFHLDPNALPYSKGREDDIDSMVKSVTKYWELLLFDPVIQEMTDTIYEYDGDFPEIEETFSKILASLMNVENRDRFDYEYTMNFVLKVLRIREKYLELLSPDVKPAERR